MKPSTAFKIQLVLAFLDGFLLVFGIVLAPERRPREPHP